MFNTQLGPLRDMTNHVVLSAQMRGGDIPEPILNDILQTPTQTVNLVSFDQVVVTGKTREIAQGKGQTTTVGTDMLKVHILTTVSVLSGTFQVKLPLNVAEAFTKQPEQTITFKPYDLDGRKGVWIPYAMTADEFQQSIDALVAYVPKIAEVNAAQDSTK